MLKRAFLVVSMLCVAVPGVLASSTLELNVGYSQVVRLAGDMATVIIGDDSIADASLGGGGTVILTGKSLGSTNLIVLDERGRQILATSIHVVPLDRRPTHIVRLIKGAAQEQSFICGPQPRCTLIDAQNQAPIALTSGTENGAASETPSSANPPSGDTESSNQPAAPEVAGDR